MLQKLSKYWFAWYFFLISLAVFAVSFFKIIILKDFILELPEDCDSVYNTCLQDGEEKIPNRFIMIKESEFLKNCKNGNFDECVKICETNNNICTLKEVEDN